MKKKQKRNKFEQLKQYTFKNGCQKQKHCKTLLIKQKKKTIYSPYTSKLHSPRIIKKKPINSFFKSIVNQANVRVEE